MENFKERMNVIKTKSGRLSAHLVNLPIVCEADSIEELKSRMKEMAFYWIKELEKTFSQDDPFDIKEFNEDDLKTKNEI